MFGFSVTFASSRVENLSGASTTPETSAFFLSEQPKIESMRITATIRTKDFFIKSPDFHMYQKLHLKKWSFLIFINYSSVFSSIESEVSPSLFSETSSATASDGSPFSALSSLSADSSSSPSM